MRPRIIIVGCVAQKCDRPMPARDLYCSPLWKKRRAYAEASGHTWGIMSARWGIVEPERELDPYDYTIADVTRQPASDHPHWFELKLLVGLARLDRDALLVMGPRFKTFRPDGFVVELHAGAPYVKKLREALSWKGHHQVEVETPLEGLQIGEQLRWYAEREAQRIEEQQVSLFEEVA